MGKAGGLASGGFAAFTLSDSRARGKPKATNKGPWEPTDYTVVVGQGQSTCSGQSWWTGERGLGGLHSVGFPGAQFTQRCARDLASTEAGLVVNVGVGHRAVDALAMVRGDVGGAIVGGAGLQRTDVGRMASINQSGSVREWQRRGGI